MSGVEKSGLLNLINGDSIHRIYERDTIICCNVDYTF